MTFDINQVNVQSNKTNNISGFLSSLDLPKACELNKPIYKKMFIDASDGNKSVLDMIDKKILKDDVEKIRWLYTLKPSTINIAPFKDQLRDYPEIAILHIELSGQNKFKRIARFVNRAIPYPLVLIFSCVINGEQKILLTIADKRINQSDKEKWVVEDSIETSWIALSSPTTEESNFFASLNIGNLPFTNFWVFYKALMDRVIAIQCAAYTGYFVLEKKNREFVEADRSDRLNSLGRLDNLREMVKLESNKSELIGKLKQIKQIGRQVELNIQIKKINDEIASIKGDL